MRMPGLVVLNLTWGWLKISGSVMGRAALFDSYLCMRRLFHDSAVETDLYATLRCSVVNP